MLMLLSNAFAIDSFISIDLCTTVCPPVDRPSLWFMFGAKQSPTRVSITFPLNCSWSSSSSSFLSLSLSIISLYFLLLLLIDWVGIDSFRSLSLRSWHKKSGPLCHTSPYITAYTSVVSLVLVVVDNIRKEGSKNRRKRARASLWLGGECTFVYKDGERSSSFPLLLLSYPKVVVVEHDQTRVEDFSFFSIHVNIISLFAFFFPFPGRKESVWMRFSFLLICIYMLYILYIYYTYGAVWMSNVSEQLGESGEWGSSSSSSSYSSSSSRVWRPISICLLFAVAL